jgi:hypothetical protein
VYGSLSAIAFCSSELDKVRHVAQIFLDEATRHNALPASEFIVPNAVTDRTLQFTEQSHVGLSDCYRIGATRAVSFGGFGFLTFFDFFSNPVLANLLSSVAV